MASRTNARALEFLANSNGTVRPIKKFTFRSYGTVSLFNYVRARYAVQLTYRYVRKRNRVSIRILTLLRLRTYRYLSWTAYLART